MFCRRFQRPFAEGAGVQPTLRRADLRLLQRGPTFLDRAAIFLDRAVILLRRPQQVCLPRPFCPVSTPVPNHPHHMQCMFAVRGKEGTRLLAGQGRLPAAACSCWNECVSGFPVAPQETVSCPGCELGLNAPDGPAAPGRKGPCLAARDKRRQDTDIFLYMLPVLDACGSDCDWTQCRTVQYTQSTFPVAQLRQTFADRISTNISQYRPILISR